MSPEWLVPLSDLDYGGEEEEAVLRVLRRRWLSMGPETQNFEREFAQIIGVKHAIAVANGTAALHLAYLALGITSGDEIVQPAINFVAAANMTKAVGAVPVFADIVGILEPTIDPAEIERLLGPRVKAVVVMHYGGHPCHMADIVELCRRHGIALIEDACHAVGAVYTHPDGAAPSGHMAGCLGDVACFSFFSNKNLAVGEGGMVTTDRDDVAAPVRRLLSHGMTTLTWQRHQGHAASYDVTTNGYNYRLDDLRAALGRAQLTKLLENNQRRRRLAEQYRTELADIAGIQVVLGGREAHSACHLEVILAPAVQIRDRLRAELAALGIQTSLHYPLIPDFSAFQTRGCFRLTNTGDEAPGLPRSRQFAERALTLPLYATMTSEQVSAVCRVIWHMMAKDV